MIGGLQSSRVLMIGTGIVVAVIVIATLFSGR